MHLLCFYTLQLCVSMEANQLGDNFKEIYWDGSPRLWGPVAAFLEALVCHFPQWHEQDTET